MDRPAPIAPKKRTNGNKKGNAVGNVDHIITFQGSNGVTLPGKINPDEGSKNCLLNGVHSGMNGLKNSLKTQLPIITDDGDEDGAENLHEADPEKPVNIHKNGYQPLNTNISSSREVIDLSPIYENSSDACSSHDDLPSVKVCKILSDESSTPNSLSQTQSETSLEMGLLTDSAKNSVKRQKKRVNILSESDETDGMMETEIVPAKCDPNDGYLTMTGTIKRGKKKGQNIDVKLNISREELEVLEAAIVAKEVNNLSVLLKCTPANGVHIFLLSVICAPFIWIVSGLYCFYIGTITWYNIFTFITDESSLVKKVVLSPIVVILFPFMIVVFTVGLGCYAAVAQLTLNANAWWKEVCDLEKGFYGWLCGLLHLPDCSPYEVVILTDLKLVDEAK